MAEPFLCAAYTIAVTFWSLKTMRKKKILKFVIFYIWPLIRHFVSKSKRCKKCLLSEHYEPLKSGICKSCEELPSMNQVLPKNSRDKIHDMSLGEVISSYKREGDKYDALLMLSGGKDSAYILARLKEEFPDLNLLCLFVDNGFSSSVAIKNAHYIANKQGVDFFVSNQEISDFKETFRTAFLTSKGKEAYGVVDFADGEKIFHTGVELANSLNLQLIIGGLSAEQVELILGNNDFRLRKKGDPEIIFPLAYWNVSETEVKKTVRQKKLLLPGTEHPLISNNDLILTMSTLDILNLGYCSFEAEFAKMIREGKANR